MKRFTFIISLVILLVGSFLLGSWYSRRETPQVNRVGAKSAAFRTDEKLNSFTDTVTDMDTSPPLSDSVRISPQTRQTIGVRVGRVEKTAQSYTLRTLGRVAADDTKIYRINIAVDGWIEKTFDNSLGSLVKKDEILATFYSPEFLAAEQAFIYALSSLDRFETSRKETPGQINLTKTNVQQYKDSLRNLGMGKRQIEEMERTRQFTENINIAAPVTGFVLSRNVSPGERFDKGKELYRIADLSRVWILVDLFENEAYDLKPGTQVRVSLSQRKKMFQATVSHVLPLFDGASRTLKMRLEAENPGFFLRPDMFVDVELPVTLPPAITVPADAVLDSGVRKTVFVDKGNGFFEPRQVETGWRLGGRIEITRGLDPGERIIISGTFLIDSESRMELAAAGIYGALVKDPVCGDDVSINKAEKAGRKSTHRGKTYYFSSNENKGQFDENPARYTNSQQ